MAGERGACEQESRGGESVGGRIVANFPALRKQEVPTFRQQSPDFTSALPLQSWTGPDLCAHKP